MNNKRLFRLIFVIIRIISYVLIVYMIYALLIAHTRFTCSWNDKYGILCPSCGATRATLSILRGDILKALEYNIVYTAAIFPSIILFILDDVVYIILRFFKLTKKSSLFEVLFEVDGGDNNV